MTLAGVALIVIALLLYAAVRTLSQFESDVRLLAEELRALREALVSARSNPPVLNQINRNLYDIKEFIQGSRNEASIESTRQEKIVQMYADHLRQTENLSIEDALLKARYIHQEFFADEWMVKRMLYKPHGVVEDQIAEIFEGSAVLATDVANIEATLYPLDLFTAVWLVLKKGEYEPGTILTIARRGLEKFDDYDAFIKKKAIVNRLLTLDLLKQLGPDRPDQLVRHRYRLTQENIETVSSMLYPGRTYDDKYLEERWRDDELLIVLEKHENQQT